VADCFELDQLPVIDVLGFLNAENPRIRFAALEAIGQFAQVLL
jgi:hypothetical protein